MRINPELKYSLLSRFLYIMWVDEHSFSFGYPTGTTVSICESPGDRNLLLLNCPVGLSLSIYD